MALCGQRKPQENHLICQSRWRLSAFGQSCGCASVNSGGGRSHTRCSDQCGFSEQSGKTNPKRVTSCEFVSNFSETEARSREKRSMWRHQRALMSRSTRWQHTWMLPLGCFSAYFVLAQRWRRFMRQMDVRWCSSADLIVLRSVHNDAGEPPALWWSTQRNRTGGLSGTFPEFRLLLNAKT